MKFRDNAKREKEGKERKKRKGREKREGEGMEGKRRDGRMYQNTITLEMIVLGLGLISAACLLKGTLYDSVQVRLPFWVWFLF